MSKKKCINTTTTVVSFTAVVWPRHTMPYIPVGEWVCCMMRPNNSCEKDYAYNHSSNKEKINVFECGWIMWLEYMIKFRLFSKKWHIMEWSLMWQNGMWLVEYNSSMWKIAKSSYRAMIGYVLIGLRTLFS